MAVLFVAQRAPGAVYGPMWGDVDAPDITVTAAMLGSIYGTVAADALVYTEAWPLMQRRHKSPAQLSTATRSNVQ